jgi:hypothetical protein
MLNGAPSLCHSQPNNKQQQLISSQLYWKPQNSRTLELEIWGESAWAWNYLPYGQNGKSNVLDGYHHLSHSQNQDHHAGPEKFQKASV